MFLSQSKDIDNKKLESSLIYDSSFHFWKKYGSKEQSQFNEPDLVIENQEEIVIIECKYHSNLAENIGETEEDYSNQLIRYSSIFEDYYKTKKKRH